MTSFKQRARDNTSPFNSRQIGNACIIQTADVESLLLISKQLLYVQIRSCTTISNHIHQKH